MLSLETIFNPLNRPELQKRFQAAIDAFLIARGNEEKKEISKSKRELDKLYWDCLESITLNKIRGCDLNFNKDEQMLINFGIVDSRVIVLEEDSEEERTKLEKKFNNFLKQSAYKEEPIYYLTEWISAWEVGAKLSVEAKGEKSFRSDWIDDDKAKKYAVIRLNIYKKFLPVLKKLPGMNLNLLKSLLTGDFDRNVELAYVQKQDSSKPLSISVQRLISLHKALLSQLQIASHSVEDKKLVALLGKINESFVQRRIGKSDEIESEKTPSLNIQRENYMINEMRLLKNLLPIGGMEGREFVTTPVLNEIKTPCSKDFVGKTLKLIRSVDPHIPSELPVVIVPYKGSGFFEWDKNTLIIPVTPSIPKEEVVIRACANYRILTDNLENRGELKRQYEKTLEKGSFKERFLQDYVNWVQKVSIGQRRIMTNKKFDFFVQYVGPDPENLFASKELIHSSNAQLRKKSQAILSSTAILSQDNFYDCAVCFWKLGDFQKSKQYMESAQTSGMPSAKILLVLGYIYKKLKDKPMAMKSFKSVVKFFKETLYASYASRELESK